MIFFLPFPCLIFLKVIGAASKEKLDVVKSLGASAVIDYNTESVKEKVNNYVFTVNSCIAKSLPNVRHLA